MKLQIVSLETVRSYIVSCVQPGVLSSVFTEVEWMRESYS